VIPILDSAFAELERGAANGLETAGLLGARPFPVRLPVVDEIWRASAARRA
jgi:hypothetical protein